MGKTKKHEKKAKKKSKHKEHKEKKKIKKALKAEKTKKSKSNEEDSIDFAIPVELMNSKSHAPETPEEYQRRQSIIRREVDAITGRTRIIKGDGEILEEIVSKQRHMEINKSATQEDGRFFQESARSTATTKK